jgi:hypothetical protein
MAAAVLAAALAGKAAQPPQMIMTLQIAHVGHYLWTLYIPPVLIVLFAIVKTTLSERRKAREEAEGNSENSSTPG